MAKFDALIARARRERHFSVVEQPAVLLTPSIFGKLLVAAWALKHGRSDLPHRDEIIGVLLSSAETAPPEVRAVMHLDDRIHSSEIAEYSEYMVAAQMDGLIKRYNPDYIRTSVEIDRLTGSHLVDLYTKGKDNLRSWVEMVVDQLSGSSTDTSDVDEHRPTKATPTSG